MTAALGDDVKDKATEFIPLQRTGKPEDVAAVVSFLAPTIRPTSRVRSSPSTVDSAWGALTRFSYTHLSRTSEIRRTSHGRLARG